MGHAIYPGTFNPFHEGHLDVVKKASKVFDKVTLAFLLNPEKESFVSNENLTRTRRLLEEAGLQHSVKLWFPSNQLEAKTPLYKLISNLGDVTAVVRGLRNGYDLQYEQNYQYLNEDIGVDIPFVYFICDRSLGHISSTAIRQLDKLGLSYGKRVNI